MMREKDFQGKQLSAVSLTRL